METLKIVMVTWFC